jgi:hypothetical protein
MKIFIKIFVVITFFIVSVSCNGRVEQQETNQDDAAFELDNGEGIIPIDTTTVIEKIEVEEEEIELQ